MTSERGAANIRRFNAEREQKNLALVEDALRLCRKRRLQFKSLGQLAAHLSDRTHIHRTTLLRNPKHKALLAVYVGAQAGGVTVVSDDTDDPHVLKAKLASAQAEVGALRQEVRRLAAQLRRFSDVPPNECSDGVDFANVCALLALVLVRAEVFAVDSRQRAIVDLAARPSERVVAGPERAGAFISWLEQNGSLPYVSSITRA